MLMQTQTASRDPYIDALKGIAILLVVTGHSISNLTNLEFLFNFIYSFHMPLLFFWSGYLEEKGYAKYRNAKGRMLVKRTTTLLVPYLLWTVLYFFIRNGVQNVQWAELATRILGYGQDCLWFLAAAFGLKLYHLAFWLLSEKTDRLLPATLRPMKSPLLALGICECIVIALALLTGHPTLTSMVTYAVPYFAGALLIRFPGLTGFLQKIPVLALALLAYMAVFPFFSFRDTGYSTQIQRIFLSLCVIVLLYGGKRFFSFLQRSRMLCLFGRRSMEIYLLQTFFIDPLKFFYAYTDSPLLLGLWSIASAILIGFFSIALSWMLSRIPMASKLLFGK